MIFFIMCGFPMFKREIYVFMLFSESRLVKIVYLSNAKLMSLVDLTFSSVTLVKLTSCYKQALVNRFGIRVVNCSATLH